MDKRHLLPKVVHPKQAKRGDYVFIWHGPLSAGRPSIDIVQVTGVTRNGNLRVEGREQDCRQADLLPPTEHRKQQYIQGLQLAAGPVVGAFTPTELLPKFPQEPKGSPHVVGRPELRVMGVAVSRSPSDYVDIRFTLTNQGSETISLDAYECGEDDGRDKDGVPFAYLGDQRFKVFQVAGGGKLHAGRVAQYRVVVSNRAGAGPMRLFIPSGILGGAVGTYTMLVFNTPPGLGNLTS
jgi:hypothetical protein